MVGLYIQRVRDWLRSFRCERCLVLVLYQIYSSETMVRVRDQSDHGRNRGIQGLCGGYHFENSSDL